MVRIGFIEDYTKALEDTRKDILAWASGMEQTGSYWRRNWIFFALTGIMAFFIIVALWLGWSLVARSLSIFLVIILVMQIWKYAKLAWRKVF